MSACSAENRSRLSGGAFNSVPRGIGRNDEYAVRRYSDAILWRTVRTPVGRMHLQAVCR